MKKIINLFRSTKFSEEWAIAYRKNYNTANHFVFNRNLSFTLIKGIGQNKWVADPFILNEKENRLEIYFELFDKLKQKGMIAKALIENENLKELSIQIEKKFHLSYPFIFESDSKLYMIPESNENKTISLYNYDFLKKNWSFHSDLLVNMDYNDTILFEYNENNWLITSTAVKKSPSLQTMIIFKVDGKINCNPKFTEYFRVSGLEGVRNAGKPIQINKEVILVSQIGKENDYGYGIIFKQIKYIKPGYAKFLEIDRINPKDIVLENSNITVLGIHTYNRSKNYEIIDIKIKKENHLLLRIYLTIIRIFKKIFMLGHGNEKKRVN